MQKKSFQENSQEPSGIRRMAGTAARMVDFRMGLIGAAVMAGIVFGINLYGTQNWWGATTASLKQGFYTLLFGGIIMRGCEFLALRIRNKPLALAAAVIIPSAISIALTYGVHSMKGTPRPIESTLVTAVLVIPSTAMWGWMKRRGATT